MPDTAYDDAMTCIDESIKDRLPSKFAVDGKEAPLPESLDEHDIQQLPCVVFKLLQFIYSPANCAVMAEGRGRP